MQIYFKSLPKGGRGQAKNLSEYLNSTSVAISQILKGNRHFTDEQSFKTAHFLKLGVLETKYFLKLVAYQKASSFELKEYIMLELIELQKESKKVKTKYKNFKELKEKDKCEFYSDRLYSATRMLSSLTHINTVDDVSNHFKISKNHASDIIDFLRSRNLIIQRDNRLIPGPQHTFISAESGYIKNHHKNWRLYAINKTENLDIATELMYTAPISLSVEAYDELREKLLKVIKETVELITPSKEEMVACLNIDLLKF